MLKLQFKAEAALSSIYHLGYLSSKPGNNWRTPNEIIKNQNDLNI